MRKLSLFIVTAWFIGLSSTPVYASQPQTSNNTASDTSPVILILGDSLSAAYGIERSNGWVNQLQQRLSDNQYAYRVVNASISGETTQGGLQRLPALLTKHQPALVILELGGNDGLRGLDIEMIKSNLQSMISRVLSTHTKMLLLGIHLPPNYGKPYTNRFAQIYVDLGKRNKIPVVPFLLAGIATHDNLMQQDDIHPTAQAQALMLKNVWPKLEPLLKKQITAK